MSAEQIQALDTKDVARLLRAGEILLVDVREASEFAAEGIAGAGEGALDLQSEGVPPLQSAAPASLSGGASSARPRAPSNGSTA